LRVEKLVLTAKTEYISTPPTAAGGFANARPGALTGVGSIFLSHYADAGPNRSNEVK
jgi:hypothetical protein